VKLVLSVSLYLVLFSPDARRVAPIRASVLCEFCARGRACRPLLCPLLSVRCTFYAPKFGCSENLSYFCTAKSRNALSWMFHGVMAALEFLVLSVPVRIGVEQLPLPPESCSLSLLARLFFLSSVYTTLLFLCMCARGGEWNSMVYNSLHFSLFLLRIHGCLFCKLATCR